MVQLIDVIEEEEKQWMVLTLWESGYISLGETSYETEPEARKAAEQVSHTKRYVGPRDGWVDDVLNSIHVIKEVASWHALLKKEGR